MTSSLYRALVLAALVACGSHASSPAAPAPRPTPASRPPPPPPPPSDGVSLKVTPADALVVIDDDSPQLASALPAVIALKPGIHQLVVTKDGFKPYRVEFSVKAGNTETFTVQLERAKP